MVSRRGVCARLEVSTPREARSHKAADRADIISTCRAPFHKVNYFKADRLLLEEMDVDWNQCAHGDADSQNTLCEKVTWNPRRAGVMPHRPWAPLPLGILIQSNEQVDTFLVNEMIVRHQNVPRFKHVEFHLNANRLPDISSIHDVATFRTHSYAPESNDIIAGCFIEPLPTPFARALQTRTGAMARDFTIGILIAGTNVVRGPVSLDRVFGSWAIAHNDPIGKTDHSPAQAGHGLPVLRNEKEFPAP